MCSWYQESRDVEGAYKVDNVSPPAGKIGAYIHTYADILCPISR